MGTSAATPIAGTSRIHGKGWRESIALAHDVIGPSIMARLGHVQYVLGADPIFIGLHSYGATEDGRSYSDVAQCLYPFHIDGPAARRVTTIVVPPCRPSLSTAHTLVHELGHALDELGGFVHAATPVTAYARTNRQEAFAEAFTAWCWPGNGYDRPASEDVALFRQVVRS